MNSDHSDHSDNSDQQITYQLKKKRRDSLKDYGTSRTTLPDGDASCLPLHARCHIRLQHRSREQDAGKGDLGVNKFDRIPRGQKNWTFRGMVWFFTPSGSVLEGLIKTHLTQPNIKVTKHENYLILLTHNFFGGGRVPFREWMFILFQLANDSSWCNGKEVNDSRCFWKIKLFVSRLIHSVVWN